jgi:hypothetical protein
VRDFAFVPALRIAAVQRRMAAKASQLNVGYAGGPLAMQTLTSRLARILGRRASPRNARLTQINVKGKLSFPLRPTLTQTSRMLCG